MIEIPKEFEFHIKSVQVVFEELKKLAKKSNLFKRNIQWNSCDKLN